MYFLVHLYGLALLSTRLRTVIAGFSFSSFEKLSHHFHICIFSVNFSPSSFSSSSFIFSRNHSLFVVYFSGGTVKPRQGAAAALVAREMVAGATCI